MQTIHRGKEIIFIQMNQPPDKEEFKKLLQENSRIIFKICHSYCTHPSDMEDLAQEITYQLWKSYPNYISTHKFTTWMYRVSLNVAISYYRKDRNKPKRVPLTEDAAFLESPSQGELEENIRLLRQFILELKVLDRALMILYLDEKSYAEMADIIGIRETNVATRISRSKKILRAKFETINKS